ncbi:MAG TPA: spore germination protein [Paenibacillus sp.]|uniref:spore germination protein n=1 Tax=Paenibacillus sp. TaxID=58172 RepID=UPI0028D18ACC|nr:spore germination protein [Paenibacillus sp.]HUC92231.1 spore germination protein [Paenibacillus sp.]
MPSIVGSININSNSGTVNFGDTLNISPKSASKSVSGPGGSTGNLVNAVNGPTINNVWDPHLTDNAIAGNN